MQARRDEAKHMEAQTLLICILVPFPKEKKAIQSCFAFNFWQISISGPVDNFGTVVGENPTPYGILALLAVNSLSIVYWG